MCLSLFPEPLDIPRNALNSAASSLRWNRANGQLPFSNWRRHFSFKTTVTVLQDWAFQPQSRRKYVTNWAKGMCVICLKKQTSVNKKYYVIAQTMTELCYKVPLRPPHDWVHLDDIKKRVATKQHDIKISRYFVACGVGFWHFESTTLLHNVGKSLPNDTASYRRRYKLSR